MNDRELIARAAYDALHRPSFGWPAWDDPANDIKGQYYAIATVAIAAIGDRLIPVFPQWANYLSCSIEDDGFTRVTLAHYHALMQTDREQLGEGMSIPAAIRDALKDGAS